MPPKPSAPIGSKIEGNLMNVIIKSQFSPLIKITRFLNYLGFYSLMLSEFRRYIDIYISLYLCGGKGEGVRVM